MILMAVLAIVRGNARQAQRQSPGRSESQGQQTNSQQSGAPQNTPRPSDAVTAYLQALAAGDAVAALSYAADPAPTGPLLTNEVLANPSIVPQLTEIHVPVVDDQNVKSVSATYTLGSTAVNESFDVVKAGGTWKLSRAVKDIDLAFVVDGSVPVKINGVKVTEKSVAVLPGSYAFTTGCAMSASGPRTSCW